MLSSFDRWEKDPFFLAAEEVQDSADRMASIYRNWIHERKDRSTKQTGNADVYVDFDLRRELHTALGTAKWQLEEFDRASRSSDDGSPVDEDARTRHAHFVSAIGKQILTIEDSLKKSNIQEGESGLSWVRLDEEERDELAAFLSGPTLSNINGQCMVPQNDGCLRNGDLRNKDWNSGMDSLRKTSDPAETINPLEREKEKVHTHRRTASAGNEIGVWMVSITNEDVPNMSLHNQPHTPLAKVFSMSELVRPVDSSLKMNLAKNGFCKWRASDRQNASETIPLQNHQGLNCYERSKDCVSCDGEPYDKQAYGWTGALQRQLQRSQYQLKYGRPVQVIFWMIAALLLIVRPPVQHSYKDVFAIRMILWQDSKRRVCLFGGRCFYGTILYLSLFWWCIFCRKKVNVYFDRVT